MGCPAAASGPTPVPDVVVSLAASEDDVPPPPSWAAPNATTCAAVIPNCGHLPHVEQPERFVSILDRFLRAEA